VSARHPLGELGAGRLVPGAAGAGAAVAAGVAFGRVFGFAALPGPLALAGATGVVAGLGARLALAVAVPAPAGGTAATTGSGEPGPAWLAGAPPAAGDTAGTGRWLGYGAAGAAVVLGALVACLLVDAVAARPTGAGRAVGGLLGGWSRILTTSVPVPPTPDRLPVLAGVVALGAALGGLLGSRRHPGIDALVPAALVLLVALALGVGGPGSVVAVSAAPTVLAGLYLLVVSRPAETGVAWVPPSRSLSALATGTVVVIVALAVGARWPLATARSPVDLRARLTPPVDVGQVANPLDLLPRLQAEPGTTMFSARVDGTWLANPTGWRLVSLDTYDGTGWTSTARATRAGTVLTVPSGEDAARLGPASRQQVRVADLPGPWVPTTGVPTSVTPADLAYDPATSMLVAGGDLRGRSFTLTDRIPAPTRAQLDSASITVSNANALLTRVPGCTPAALTQLAQQSTTGLSRPDQQAVALEQALASRGGFALDPAATPGSSCGRLRQFVAARQGTVEQFATAFVLMARSLGLPARMVVGFTPGSVDDTTGTATVHGSDATAWPEVGFARIGWVRFDPVPTATHPTRGGGAGATTTTTDRAQQGLNQVRSTVATPNPTAPPRPGVPGGGRHPVAGGGWSPWYLIPIAVVVAAAALVAGRLGIRQRRRARRRDPSRPPGDRIRGAWAEVLDALAPFEAAVATLTPTEVTAEAARAAPAAEPPVRDLGALVDRSTYAGAADGDDAEDAWRMSDTAVAALRRAVPPGRRLRDLAAGGPRRVPAGRP
jgi:transglutaminase-like putative cysteine protease